MQQNGPKNIGFFGTRNMGFMHQNLIEILSYAMVLTVQPSHLVTSTISYFKTLPASFREAFNLCLPTRIKECAHDHLALHLRLVWALPCLSYVTAIQE